MKNNFILSSILLGCIIWGQAFAGCEERYAARISAIENNPKYEEKSPERSLFEMSMVTGSVIFANKWAAAAVASGYAHYLVINPNIIPVLTGVISTAVVLEELQNSKLINEKDNHQDMMLIIRQAERGFGVALESLQTNLAARGLELSTDIVAKEVNFLNDTEALCPVDGQLSTVYGVESMILNNHGVKFKRVKRSTRTSETK